MAVHTEGVERFEKAIFKQREEINDIMEKMFGLLKELTTSRALEKEEGKVVDKNVVEPNESDVAKPIEVIDRKEETEGEDDVVTVRNVEKEPEEELVEMPRS
nr:hypothetical protein [Tanacetum cinerariifolium]